MRGKWLLVSVLLLGLMLVAVVGLGLAQGTESGEGAAPQEPLGTGFTYQGRLTDAGGLVDDQCDVQFSLWDAAGSGEPPTGGTQIGATQTKTGVEVAEGLFTIPDLDFGGAAFTGQARWLQIAVRCPAGGGTYATLAPRQALTAVPQALYATTAPWSGLSGVPPGFADGDDDTLGGLACNPDQIAAWSGTAWVCAEDADTTYTPGTGLDLSAGAFSLLSTYQLPQACGSDQIAAWNGTEWVCAEDADTTYIPGTGLDLSADAFSLLPTYQLPQACADGQVTKWETSQWVCGDDDVGGGEAAWLLTGNAGTQHGVDVLGTSDPASLTLVVDSAPALRLEYTGLAPNVVGGDPVNSATPGAWGATIGGGGDSAEPNRVSDKYGTVGGGSDNQAGDGDGQVQDVPWPTVAGGRANAASGGYATVGGGYYNLAQGNYATIAGGGPSDVNYPDTTNNRVTDSYGTIGGGGNNQAGDGDGDVTNSRYATVGGGWGNQASGDDATVGGGFGNEASGSKSTVGGGDGNEATGYASAVGGGLDNQAAADFATIAGGGRSDVEDPSTANRVTDDYGTIGGGGHNQAGDDDGDPTDAEYATVGGGYYNTASGEYATVGGGRFNQAVADFATIAGGGPSDVTNPANANRVTDNYGTIGGGGNNRAGDGDGDLWSASFATVGGGAANHASGHTATIGGGVGNTASGHTATISGGGPNLASGRDATIGGGGHNIASGSDATIGGGFWNTASGHTATIAGGTCITVTDDYGTVAGGYSNQAGDDAGTTADRSYAAVGGGRDNIASGTAATVGGGDTNTASGWRSTVPGGAGNIAAGAHSFAAGRRAKVDTDAHGSFVWSDNNDLDTWSWNPNEFVARATGGFWLITGIDGTGTITSGAHLASGSGEWSQLSDRSVKTAFAPVDGREVLARVAELPIETWQYVLQDGDIRHMGPMAQDFHAAFGLGEDERYIGTLDADGVALAAIQGLYDVSQDQAGRIEALEAENATQQAQIDDLEARLAALEKRRGDPASSPSRLPGAWLLLGGLVLVAGVGVQRRLPGGGR